MMTESVVEEAVLGWLGDLGYAVAAGRDLAPDGDASERATFADVVLVGRLRAALAKINPTLPADALAEAVRRVTHPDTPGLIETNRRLHALLTDGVAVEVRRPDGTVAGDTVWLIDFADPAANDFLAVNQFTVTEDRHTRRMDVVVFVNGLPLAVVELKNPAAAGATARDAFRQLQTYKAELPRLFGPNLLLVASDGLEARVGTLTADWERFMPWRTTDGRAVAPKGTPELEVLVAGVFDRRRLLDLLRHFVVFEADGPTAVKKLAGYHQYHAVNKAMDCTVAASGPAGDRKVGVVWHTQGSGKSLTMVFYAGKVVRHPRMNNPTLVVLTDRNDLDDQLFATFAGCRALLRQTPVQADGRDDLRAKLAVASGGVIFTTIQKFAPARGERYPRLSDRANVVVIADEAHRSQYGLDGTVDPATGAVDYGFAKHLRDALPNASFVGFTGTPVTQADRNTPRVFGEYIDVYDLHRAVEDGATVKIYYEGRLAKLGLKESERPTLDAEFEEVTEGEEPAAKEKAKTKWARLEALVGSDTRVALVARDLVEHFERRLEALDGKGMVVCMSRRICVDLYARVVELRPHWHDADDDKGAVKVVMTGSAADGDGWQGHIRTKARREALARRLKDPADPLRLVIVRDMWLTGFDAPCLHTLYTDKPMRGHGLMQAIARVNRVFKDKPGGLVVDYLGLADQLKRALAEYTAGDRQEAGVPVEAVVGLLRETVEVVRAMLHGFDSRRFFTGPPGDRLGVLAGAREFLLEQARARPDEPDAKARFLAAVGKLGSLLTLAMPHEAAVEVRDEVAFFQGVRAGFVKLSAGGAGRTDGDTDSAIRQLISKAVASEQVIDVFAAAGLKRPDLSILSDEFLAEVRGMPHRNLALELLRKLLGDDIQSRSRKNLTQARSFAAMLDGAVRAYQNRSLESAQVIDRLIALAKDMREAHRRGEALDLSDDEVAFYDALEVNDSAVRVLGDDALRRIARELVETVRGNTAIDWTLKESAKAHLRRLVRRVLNTHGYPPDKQAKAVQTVLDQAELLARDWAA